jgi:hypothetical protein
LVGGSSYGATRGTYVTGPTYTTTEYTSAPVAVQETTTYETYGAPVVGGTQYTQYIGWYISNCLTEKQFFRILLYFFHFNKN